MMLLMPNVSLNMPSAFAIRCGCGSHPDPFCKNWRPSVRFANAFCWFVNNRTGDPVQQPITEQEGFVDSALQKQLAKSCQASLKAINADLEDTAPAAR